VPHIGITKKEAMEQKTTNDEQKNPVSCLDSTRSVRRTELNRQPEIYAVSTQGAAKK